MSSQPVWLIILASVISGLVGVAVSTAYYRWWQKRRMKLDTLTRLLGYRFDLKSPEFLSAINEVIVVFHDSPKVMTALRAFHNVAVTQQKPIANDSFVELLRAVATNCGVKHEGINDSMFLKPFN